MNLTRNLLSTLAILSLAAAPTVARAEGPQQPPPGGGPMVVEQQPPPPGYGQQPPPPGYGQQPGYGQPGMAAPMQPMQMRDQGRLRLGFDVGGFGFFGGGSGGGIDATLQIGWQLDRTMGIYLFGRGFVGGGGSSDGTTSGTTAWVVAGSYLGPAIDWTFNNVFQVGAGLSFDSIALASGGFGCASGFGGNGIGLDGRLALMLGGGDPALQRAGFELVLNVHPTVGFGDYGAACGGGASAGSYTFFMMTASLGLGWALY